MTSTGISSLQSNMANQESLLNEAVKALYSRNFYTPYPEHPKVYGEGADEAGKAAFIAHMNENFTELNVNSEQWIGSEVSPYLQTGIGVRYPQIAVENLISNANACSDAWAQVPVQGRAYILIESLERIKQRFFEIAYATMHTTGQSFIMSFQASGPHANDRALEAIAMGYAELSRFPSQTTWVKPMGKFDLSLEKTWKAVPKGISLVIGCSTFPTWNTVPGVYASLITGNPVIVKPHPKAILPIAIVVAEIRKVFAEQNLPSDIIQLAVDTIEAPVTKSLAEHPEVKMIDYTGGSAFGEYIEGLNKVTFTEKAGVNSVIIDSATDLNAVMQNIAFSASLYSGQMCTAPQNIFIPETGVNTSDGIVSYQDALNMLKDAVHGLATHPKMGAGTLGAIQNDATIQRITEQGNFGGNLVLKGEPVLNPEFEHARTLSISIVELNAHQKEAFAEECFGPLIFVIRTKNTSESIALAAELAEHKGAITCLAFSTDPIMRNQIELAMNKRFVPVSFNLGGAAFVNQHAAFSDFHVTGGNPAGNASFTNPEYINKRFVWVGNRYMHA